MNESIRFRSLFVSDLSTDVTEVALLNAFCSSGPIASVRIVRNKETAQSRGFGYINFVNEKDARNALNTKNFMEVSGKRIRLTAAQSDPKLLKENNANVFVKNLDKCVDNKRLYDTFMRFGAILSCKVAQEVNGESKGFGFVQFECQQSAIDAIIAMNGRQLDRKVLSCGKFMPQKLRQKYIRNAIDVKNYANIYVKNLSPEFDENILKQMFDTFGPIIALKVFHKNSKHFGFVCFADSMTASNAIKGLNGKPLPNGWPLYVSRALRLAQNNSTNRLARKHSGGHDIYVKYLDQSIDSEKLVEVFSPFGLIRDAVTFFPLSLCQSSVKFGFIRFSSPESAKKAVEGMNNTVIENKPLFVSIARPLIVRNKSLVTNFSLKTNRKTTFRKQLERPLPLIFK